MDHVKRAALAVLEGRAVHAGLTRVLERVPQPLRNAPIEGLPYTLWELLEHIRLAQRDILEHMVDADYQPGTFPDDYWPKAGARMDWAKSVREYDADLKKIRSLINRVDLSQELPFGERGHTYMREVLILAAHTSYHLGQMVTILRLQGIW